MNILTTLRPHDLYDYERPRRVPIHTLNTRAAISHALNATNEFATSYGNDLKLLTKGYG